MGRCPVSAMVCRVAVCLFAVAAVAEEIPPSVTLSNLFQSTATIQEAPMELPPATAVAAEEIPPSVTLSNLFNNTATIQEAPMELPTETPTATPPPIKIVPVVTETPPPALPPVNPFQNLAARRYTGTRQLSAPPAVTPSTDQAVLGLMRWGAIQFRPHFNYRISRSDNLQSEPGEKSPTTVQEFSPGGTLELGRHWTLDYTPTLNFYSSSDFQDGVDHSVSLSGWATSDNWRYGLTQSFDKSSDPLVETASQTDEQTYSTALNAVGQLSTKLSLELNFNQDLRFVDQNSNTGEPLTDSRDWSTMNWLNYQFWPSFGAAAGAGFGYSQPGQGSDMTYEQLQGRVSWRPGTKLSFTVNGGAEIRQFLDSSVPTQVNPIVGVAINYQLFEPTTLGFNFDHSTTASYYEDSVNENTSLSGSLRQRLFGKLYFDVRGGWSRDSYQSTTSDVTPDRDDDYTYVNLRLSAQVRKYGNVAVFYQRSDSSSDTPGYGYTSTEYGLELSYRF